MAEAERSPFPRRLASGYSGLARTTLSDRGGFAMVVATVGTLEQEDEESANFDRKLKRRCVPARGLYTAGSMQTRALQACKRSKIA